MKKKFIFSGVVLILCLPLCVAVGCLYSLHVPREYYSKATIEVEPDRYQANLPNTPFEKFVHTPFYIIQSKEVLYPVIDELKLGEKWAGGKTKFPQELIYFRLRKMMDVEEVQYTDLVEIGVYNRDPQEAANIANTIAVQYRKRRIDDNDKMFALNLSEIKDEMDKQQQKVESAHAEVVAIFQREHIIDPTPERLDSQAQNQSEEYRTAKEKYLREKALLDSAETRFATQKMEMQISVQPVKILEKAEPAMTPARPNVLLILLFATGIGMIFAIPGLVLLLVGLSMKDSPIGRGV